MRTDDTAYTVTSVEEGTIFGVMPGKVRYRGVVGHEAIQGPDGLWLELEKKENGVALTYIATTTVPDLCNIVLS